MDFRRWCSHRVLPFSLLSSSLLLVLAIFFSQLAPAVRANAVFPVRHKYGGSAGRAKVALRELRAHDSRRHGRSLADVDFAVGGDGSPTSAALYFTKVTIGTPPGDYHVQIDTGSDILWVNCKDCENCPTKTDLKIQLRQYDVGASSTGRAVGCDQEFCSAVFQDNPLQNCKAGMNCEYSVSYGDGSKTQGFFVRDTFAFDQVSGSHQTSPMDGSIAFGCSYKQSGDSSASSSQAVDGIVGLGQANTSILSQLAQAGKVRRVFSHCLDGRKGGGVFAIGEVAEPRFNSTPLVPNQPHYNAELESITAGDAKLRLPWDFFGLASANRAVIDSGTTLAYLPADMYNQVVEQVLARQPGLKLYLLEGEFKCFSFGGEVDEGFPVVSFNFKGAPPLALRVYPRDYLFEVGDGEYCIGWQSSGVRSREGHEMTLLGDLALSDKLVVYDLERQAVGWTEHDCSTGIKLRDNASGNAYDVSATNLSGSPLLRPSSSSSSILLLLVSLALLRLLP
ncbi:aspartic proteinase 39-like [Andrographis paniculata]|uniref:aspartic proteinase 39-like n=1 Tax=Andrographis paniculata TaxID=175694 RepID=UPI0021E76170|nr:aspartic proteinase 39-like [Andrographis paniculata]